MGGGEKGVYGLGDTLYYDPAGWGQEPGLGKMGQEHAIGFRPDWEWDSNTRVGWNSMG